MDGTSFEKFPLSFDEFLLTETPLMKPFLLPVKKIYLNTVSLLSYDTEDENRALAAGSKFRTQRVVYADRKYFSPREEIMRFGAGSRKKSPTLRSKDLSPAAKTC